MTDEPFGRQPKPVTVTIEGDSRDVVYWIDILSRRAEFKGNTVDHFIPNKFVIYPRAVND